MHHESINQYLLFKKDNILKWLSRVILTKNYLHSISIKKTPDYGLMSHPGKKLFSKFAACRIESFLEIMPMKRQYSTFAYTAIREVNKSYLFI